MRNICSAIKPRYQCCVKAPAVNRVAKIQGARHLGREVHCRQDIWSHPFPWCSLNNISLGHERVQAGGKAAGDWPLSDHF